MPNPIKGLIRSRKVWIVIVDAVGGILGLWVSYLVADIKLAALIMSTWALLQGVIYAVIRGIVDEDVAKLDAASRDLETKAYAARTVTIAKTEAAGQVLQTVALAALVASDADEALAEATAAAGLPPLGTCDAPA